MTLYEGNVRKNYQILGVFVENEVSRRLEALGMNEGTAIRILNRKRMGAMIIKVRGTRLALGRHITTQIEIKEEA